MSTSEFARRAVARHNQENADAALGRGKALGDTGNGGAGALRTPMRALGGGGKPALSARKQPTQPQAPDTARRRALGDLKNTAALRTPKLELPGKVDFGRPSGSKAGAKPSASFGRAESHKAAVYDPVDFCSRLDTDNPYRPTDDDRFDVLGAVEERLSHCVPPAASHVASELLRATDAALRDPRPDCGAGQMLDWSIKELEEELAKYDFDELFADEASA